MTPDGFAAPYRPFGNGNGGDADTGSERLVSGEAVEFEIRYARASSRALALLIDIIVQVCLAITLIFVAIMILLLIGGADPLLRVASIVVSVLVLIAYPTIMETMTSGRTVGKRAMGLRVVRDDGGPVRFRHALTRALVGAAVEWPGLVMPLVTWVASLWTMLVNPRGKRLGDLAAGTIVIHERTAASWGWVPMMPPHLAGWAATLDLTGLPDDLALAVRHFLARNRQFREPAVSRLGFALATEVATAVTPPPPVGTPGWAYLTAVLAERNRRAMYRLARARVATAAVWPELSPVEYQPHAALRPPAPLAVTDAWRVPPPPHPTGPVPGPAAQGEARPAAIDEVHSPVRPPVPR